MSLQKKVSVPITNRSRGMGGAEMGRKMRHYTTVDRKPLLCLSLVTFALSTADAAKILGIFPLNSKSHFYFNEAIMKSLADAGHDVVVVAPFPTAKRYENLQIIDSRINKSENNLRYADHDFKSMSLNEYLQLGNVVLEQDCYDFMEMPEIRSIFAENVVFDVMFVELMPFYQCFLPLAQKLDIPVIGTMSISLHYLVDIGNFAQLIFPFPFAGLPNTMSMRQRLLNVYYYVFLSIHVQEEILPKVRKFYRRYYPLYDLETDERLLFGFDNNHVSVQPVPRIPNVAEIGGIHLRPTEPLPEDLEKFITESENGVILFSMGTVSGAKVIDTKLREIFRNAFAEIPQRVIWKFSHPVANLSSNVLKLDWLPQPDILVHDNVKLFVSHCGVSSTYEAIYAGKPMVMVPVILDQPTNAAMLQENGAGVVLDLKTLTKEQLVDAIGEVVNNRQYQQNMEKLSRAFKDRPISPRQTVVYWTEYVLRYKGSDDILKDRLSSVCLYQYLYFDVALFMSVIVLIATFVLYIMVRTCKSLFS